MDDREARAMQLLDQSVICDFYLSVRGGKQLNDDAVFHIILYVRHQLRAWKVSHGDTSSARKDSILLCLSTLLYAAKKKLCAIDALLGSMKNSQFNIVVSKLNCITLFYRNELNYWILHSAISNADEQMQALSASVSVSRY